MKSLWLVLLFTCSAAVFLPETVGCGFGYELIINRLESIETELMQFKLSTNNALAQQSKLMEEILDHSRTSASKTDRLIEDMRLFKLSTNNAMEENLHHTKTSASKIATMETKVDQLMEYLPLFKLSTSNASAQQSTLMEEILDHTKTNASETNLYIENGWTVIQRRISGGRLSFNRMWAEYRDGFGDPEGDYWMGLEKMHQLTRQDTFELLVVLKSFAGVEKSAKYDRFRIASESQQYRLDVGKFIEGDARDNLQIHNGMKFSTPDRDNDTHNITHCAKKFSSGWWFRNCFDANLNGVNTEGNLGLVWYDFNYSVQNLKEARMMIRRAGSNVP